ncbi:unnamed protein product [Rotaria magnacalcarata]
MACVYITYEREKKNNLNSFIVCVRQSIQLWIEWLEYKDTGICHQKLTSEKNKSKSNESNLTIQFVVSCSIFINDN